MNAGTLCQVKTYDYTGLVNVFASASYVGHKLLHQVSSGSWVIVLDDDGGRHKFVCVLTERGVGYVWFDALIR